MVDWVVDLLHRVVGASRWVVDLRDNFMYYVLLSIVLRSLCSAKALLGSGTTWDSEDTMPRLHTSSGL